MTVVPVRSILHGERGNAALGWLFTAVIAAMALLNLALGDPAWALLAGAITGALVVPAATTRDPSVMVPWLLPFLAAVAVAANTVGAYPEVAGYLAISSLALVAVTDLIAFTDVYLSPRFSVLFVVMTTMAAQGLWIVVAYYSDAWLDTTYLASLFELQMDFVVVTVVALVYGAFFEAYVAVFEHAGSRARPPRTIRSR